MSFGLSGTVIETTVRLKPDTTRRTTVSLKPDATRDHDVRRSGYSRHYGTVNVGRRVNAISCNR